MVSKLVKFLRNDLVSLNDACAIDKVKMRKFDAIYLPSAGEFSAADIKPLREKLELSQPVFVLHLQTTAFTVRKR